MEAVAVPARIDAGNAVEVLDSLKQAAVAAGEQPLALDLLPLVHFDSSALSLLLELLRERSGRGTASGAAPDAARIAGSNGIVLLNPPQKLQELAELYGIAEMLFGAVAGTVDVARPN
ncbi:MAG: hypothetical protein H0T52_08935 [Lautropia sp.]|nr:hypothetical protein [Lautropia sp.]